MKKFLTSIFASIMLVFGCVGFSSCTEFEEALDLAFENQLLRVENEELKTQVEDLESELDNILVELNTLKFESTYPNRIIGDEANVILEHIDVTVEGEGDAVTVTDSATVIIKDGKYNGGQTPFGGAGNTAIYVNSVDAKVIIENGYFFINGLAVDEEGTKDAGHIDLIYCSAGTIEISGGYFVGANSDVWLVNCKDAAYQDGTAKIIITGGTFINFDPSNCVSEGEGTNFVAEGYIVEKETIDGVDYYKVVKAPEVQDEIQD